MAAPACRRTCAPCVTARGRAILDLPMLNALSDSNDLSIQNVAEMVMNAGGRKVGLIGLSFKAGTDDLRESPAVGLAERLFGKGYDLKIFDANVNYSKLMGSNLSYIQRHIPHLSERADRRFERCGGPWRHHRRDPFRSRRRALPEAAAGADRDRSGAVAGRGAGRRALYRALLVTRDRGSRGSTRGLVRPWCR